MSWCCINAQHSETDAVEINLRSTLDATEAWLEMCKAKRAHNGRQRRANEARRTKLEQDRNALFDDKEKAHEALQRIQADINAIDIVIAKLEDAEAEIERLDHELELEELDMKVKEESIQEHLSLISNLAVTGVGSSTSCVTAEHILNTGATPMSQRNLKSIKSPRAPTPSGVAANGAMTGGTLTGFTNSTGTGGATATARLPYFLQPPRRLSLVRSKSATMSHLDCGTSPITPPITTTGTPPNGSSPVVINSDAAGTAAATAGAGAAGSTALPSLPPIKA